MVEEEEAEEYVRQLNLRLRKGWTAHLSPDGRIYYQNHETKISSWLPPVESWDSGGLESLPYGWETAIDKDGKLYYINHMNRTTTYESPGRDSDDEPPQPREVQLVRDPQMGFGFVAGSEKPVIVRFVTEGGPNEQKLMPGDQILKINGEDVMRSPREHVIERIRSCEQTVILLVCQPQTSNTTRKSALLTAAKKEKLKKNPPRVRFSEGVVINGSPLYSTSPSDVPYMPNVLKVFLENGQTKSFKYDSTTTVQDVLNSLFEKLSITSVRHFCLATEHVKITRRNRLTLLNPKDLLSKIASKPGAHHLRCVFRIAFVPNDHHLLMQRDPVAFEYLYLQCCNDVVEERFSPELKYDMALRLTALNMQQHCLSSGIQGKVTLKTVERECGGLERFVPISLLETMKPKELRKVLGHFLKQNQSLMLGQKQMTPLQVKLHYLKMIGELPSYGSKCFATNLIDSNPEMTLLVSPRFGVSQVASMRNSNPITLARIEELSSVRVKGEDEYSCLMQLTIGEKQPLTFSMEEKDTDEFVLLLKGYFLLLTGKELIVEVEAKKSWNSETVPSFHSRHIVREAPWSYPLPDAGLRTLDLEVLPPPYTPYCELPRNGARTPDALDHNMNETDPAPLLLKGHQDHKRFKTRMIVDERHPGIDYQSVLSMELLEDSAGDVDVDIHEAKNDEVIRRILEMSRILTDTESYLSDGCNETPRVMGIADSLSRRGDESDTDSTPNESPLHRSVPIRNSINASSHSTMRRDSSFGLHSPDLLPNIRPENNILDILRHLQAEEVQLPFAEETLCLDPDIIDLTMIPPPATPDNEIPPLEIPPETPPKAFDGEDHFPEAGISNEEKELSIDSFIATLSIPLPPEDPLSPVSNEDLSAYIIPPPPSSSPSTEAQEAVIARFMAAAEDIRSMFHSDGLEMSQLDSEIKMLTQRCLPCVELDTLSSHTDSGCQSGDSSNSDTIPGSIVSDNVSPCLDPSSSPSSSGVPSQGFQWPIQSAPRIVGSCDNLLGQNSNELSPGMVRSASWNTIADNSQGEIVETDDEVNNFASTSHPSLRRNHLRRSFHRGRLRNNLSHASKPNQDIPEKNTNIGLVNGTKFPVLCLEGKPNASRNYSEEQVNGLSRQGYLTDCPFQQAQRDISSMMSHLKIAYPSKVVSEDAEKLRAAKDALVSESRHFVTSSKLFVKSAMESSNKTIENMAVCVALLNRMTAIGELIVLRSRPSEAVAYLVEKLKEVTQAYLYTVEAAQRVISVDKTQMSTLMQRATELATTLTSLMRTLRAMS